MASTRTNTQKSVSGSDLAGIPDDLKNLNIDSVILILPKSRWRPEEFIHLKNVKDIEELKGTPPDKKLAEWQARLLERLILHDFRSSDEHRDAETYTNLYKDSANGNVNPEEVRKLLWQRCSPTFPQPFEDTDDFADADDFDPMIEKSVARLEEEIANRRLFRERPDPEDKGECFPVPEQMQGLTTSTESFIGNSGKADVPFDRAQKWLNGAHDGITLANKMQVVADHARTWRTIYHEPHHDLTPGILLIDEIFRALVEEVGVKAGLINPLDLDHLDDQLRDLRSYVNGLEQGMGESKKFGTYILHSGPLPCPRSGGEIHVDPSRVELFLEGNRIRVTSVIVGAWAGGTHSTGHTS